MLRNWIAYILVLACVGPRPTAAASCSLPDQIFAVAVANEALSCLGLTVSDAGPLADEFADYQQFPSDRLHPAAEACLAVPCPAGEEACVAKVACLNQVLADLNEELGDDDAWALSDNMVKVGGNFCKCYKKLDNIKPKCYGPVSAYGEGGGGWGRPTRAAVFVRPGRSPPPPPSPSGGR